MSGFRGAFGGMSFVFMVVGCFICYKSSRVLLREEHTLVLDTPWGKVNALKHRDGEYVQRVADALSNHLSA